MKMPLHERVYLMFISGLFYLLYWTAAVKIPLEVEQLPTITEQSPQSQLALSHDEEFPVKCGAQGNPQPTFGWTKDGKDFDPSSDPRVTTVRNSGTFIIMNSGNMTDFQGIYRCYATNKLGTAVSEEIEFIAPKVPRFSKEKIDPVAAEVGESVILPCNPPASILPVHTYWMSLDLKHIPQSKRVSMGRNGNLYFANVKEEDSRTDYHCVASFPSLRTIVQKTPMALDVKRSNVTEKPSTTLNNANSIKLRKPKFLIPFGHHSERTVVKGEHLHLECIAEGLPTPDISWIKVAGDLPSERTSEENFGKVLKIINISGLDEGIYQCTAKNSEGATEHKFWVTVEEPPQWISKPESKVYVIGSHDVLTCEASGKPKPIIQWMKDGKPIDESNSPSHQGITLSNLQPHDSAVFQCEASNKYGSILATANVNVLNSPPMVLTEDDIEYTTVVGKNISLHCSVFGSPEPGISWLKKNLSVLSLEDPRYLMHDNGSLKIIETQKEDSGFYTCLSNNSLGEKRIKAILDVKDRTRIEVPPENLFVQKSTTAQFKCQAAYDSFFKNDFRLSWQIKGDEIVPKDTDNKFVIDDDVLSIINVTSEDQGTYTCVASTLLDSATAEAQLTVTDVPNPPEEVTLLKPQDRSVYLTWIPGDDHNSPVIEYIVEYEENRWEPGKWHVQSQVSGRNNSVVLSLIPHVNYQFRVSSVNSIGRSLPSKPSERFKTPPAAPDKNPENVRGEGYSPSEMRIIWEPLKLMERNGPELEYKISWRRQGVEENWNEYVMRRHSYIIKNTSTFTPYDIKVQAVNQIGPGPEAAIVTVYSGEDYPVGAPSDVNVEIMNSTLIRVTWSRVPKEKVRGRIGGYKIIWWKVRNLLEKKMHHDEKHTLTFNGDRNHGMVPSLEPFCKYNLSVMVFNGRGNGPGSPTITFATPEGVPGQPTYIKTANLDSHSIALLWGPPEKPNGILTSYVLQYQYINNTEEIGDLKEINISDPEIKKWKVSELNASSNYKFYLRACNSVGCGKPLTEEGITVTGEGFFTTFSISTASPTPVANDSPPSIAYTGLHGGISTQGWFIGLLCAIALLTLFLLIVCFIKRNKGGKYSVKEKEDLHPDPEAQSLKGDSFEEYGDSDEKPLKTSLQSLDRDSKPTESTDSLVDYGEAEHAQFNEDGSFIGEYAGSKEKKLAEGNKSSGVTSVSA
ncbi:neural cell adhesion molecule L1-like protein isoform X1 [Latimeria chalumnae]|uniref:neural cell adhesion molecule L1-like protein isoform X1 n=1 Tax=Latimeria chalumnae TaxID=7897 RepID=UPI0003C1A3FC|nr:PREDICTED: neural cell adhesion molecule L1-like protein isoform X1 [Latimeria chalumnae]XP_014352401.1 PREDICTED: neural cell adhesion molecule L1-like protein isoform X1 [Latimeria chalumnae]XP_014352402.1 PREDICTED: neural cell adhesion molecule L1-like protein isoform X1 [Latimeria chalumnae]|eukprot:XP_006009842.1 PREDICTED: neural cell adhesion molecule L1-like protein isoform X1 [Latimeria chalumnae]